MNRTMLVPALLTFGCLDLPEVTESGVHVVVAADPGLELCAGSLTHMDEFVARMYDEFALRDAPPTGDDRFRFYWLEPEGFHERTGCPDVAHACARGGSSFTPTAPINHELVHNVSATFGRPLPFFTEGLAVAYEGLGAEDSEGPRGGGDVRSFIGLTTSVQLIWAGGYGTAGAFTAHLIDRHGLGAYMKMYATVGGLETIKGVDQIFRDTFGASLDATIRDFEARDDCSEAGRDAKLIECSAPALEWDGDALTLHRSIACDQDDAVGPFSSNAVVIFHTFTVPEFGEYVIQVIGDDTAVSVLPCTPCAGEGVRVEANEPPETVTLLPGRHSLRLHGSADTRASLGLRIAAVDPQ